MPGKTKASYSSQYLVCLREHLYTALAMVVQVLRKMLLSHDLSAAVANLTNPPSSQQIIAESNPNPPNFTVPDGCYTILGCSCALVHPNLYFSNVGKQLMFFQSIVVSNIGFRRQHISRAKSVGGICINEDAVKGVPEDRSETLEVVVLVNIMETRRSMN